MSQNITSANDFEPARSITYYDSYKNESQSEENDGTVSIIRITKREAEEAANVLPDYFERDFENCIEYPHQAIKKRRILIQIKVTDWFSNA